MHGSHIYSEGAYRSMSADVDNIICLCYHCHFQWWHKNPIEASEWFNAKYPERAKILKERARKSQQADLWFWEQKWKELNGKSANNTTE